MAEELTIEHRRELSRFDTVEFTPEEIREALGGLTLHDARVAPPIETPLSPEVTP